MKKIVVLLLFLTCAFVSESQAVSQETQKSIQEMFKKNNMHISAMSYSDSDKVLTLKGISASIPFLTNGSLKIEEIIITELNEAALKAKQGELPNFAKKMTYKNVQLMFEIEKHKAEVSIAEASATEIKQNYAVLFQGNATSKDIINALTRVATESITYKDMKIKVNGEIPFVASAKNTEIKELTLEKMKSMVMQGIEILSEDVAKKESVVTRIGAFNLKDVGMLSEEYSQFLLNNIAKIVANSLSPEEAKKYNAITDAYKKLNPTTDIKLENIVTETVAGSTKTQHVAIKEISLTALLDVKDLSQFDLGLLIKGLNINYAQLGAPSVIVSSIFKSDQPILDIDIKSAVKTKDDLSFLNIGVTSPNAFGVKLEAKAQLPKGNLLEIFSYPTDKNKMLAFLMGSHFSSLSITSDAFSWKMPGAPKDTVKLAGANTALTYDFKSATNAKYVFDLLGLELDLAALGLAPAEMAVAKTLLNTDTPNIISKLDINFNTDNTPTSLEFSIKSPGVAAINAKFTLNFPQKKITELIDFPPKDEKLIPYLMSGTFSNAKITYVEDGFAPRLLAFGGAMQNKSPAQTLPMALLVADQGLEAYKHLLTPTSMDAIRLCLQKPGTLSIDANAKKPLPLNPSSLGALQQAGALLIDVKCEAGKDILAGGAATSAPTPKQETPKQASTKPAPPQKAPTDGELVAPLEKAPGVALVVKTMHDTMGTTSFGVDGKSDMIVRVLAYGNSPVIGVLVQNMGGKAGSWKTKDAKGQAPGVLAVEYDGIVQNVSDNSFSINVKEPKMLDLIMQDNGTLADKNTQVRVVFFHKDGTRTVSNVKR